MSPDKKPRKKWIRAVCVEGRPYEEFGEDSWWSDVGLILKECTRLGMKVWILDDMRCPTGYAANFIRKNNIEPKKFSVISYSMDALGPVTGGAALINYYLRDRDDEIIGVYACRREKNSEVMTGEIIDLTENISGDFVYFDLPDGCYRISVVVKTLRGYSERELNRIDMLSEESAGLMIKAVYEPHYEHFKEYFGNTLEGFFSDEPCFDNHDINGTSILELGRAGTYYPWNDCLTGMLKAELGEDAAQYLPFLWQKSANHIEAKIRTAYMNCITRLYQKNFSEALGDWCREHGVLYTGHVIEDNNINSKTSVGAGHSARSPVRIFRAWTWFLIRLYPAWQSTLCWERSAIGYATINSFTIRCRSLHRRTHISVPKQKAALCAKFSAHTAGQRA